MGLLLYGEVSVMQYAYFAQFDWLKKTFYSSINSLSKNLETSFLPLGPEICNNVDKNKILMKSWNYKESIINFVDFIDV